MIKLFLVVHFIFSVVAFAQSERDNLFLEVEAILDRAKFDNADVLCKETYSSAIEEYLLAKNLETEGKSPVAIREKLEASIAHLTELNNSIEGKQDVFATVIAKRNSALDSGANKNAKYFWNLGEDRFQDVIEDYDDNNIKSINTEIKVINEYYSTAKLYSNNANSLINDSESFKEATNKQANLTAPNSYEKAEEKMFETLDLISSGKRISDINNSITNTGLLFDLTSINASKYSAEYPELLSARNDAKIVEAEKYTIETWKLAEELLVESAEAYEDEKFEKATELAKEAEDNYTVAKQTSLKDFFLNDTRNEIDLAIEEGAEEFAPKTLKQSQDYLNKVSSLIEGDSYSLSTVQQLTKKSHGSAKNARRITEIAKRMEPGDQDWEDIIILQQGFTLDEISNDVAEIDKKAPIIIESNNNASADYSDLVDKLGATIGDETEIIEQDGKVVLRLENVHFSTMSSKLNKKSKASLDKVIGKLSAESFSEATITCYTDNIGTKSSNMALSKKRAEAVLQYILTKDDSNKYFVEGKGEESPIASNSTAEGRIKNRRVEIEIER